MKNDDYGGAESPNDLDGVAFQCPPSEEIEEILQ